MKTNKTIRFPPEMDAWLTETARATNASVADVVRHAVQAFMDGKATAHELKEAELRMAASLYRNTREIHKVGEDVQLVIALIDQLVRFQFVVTPEVIDKTTANAIGKQRYDGFIQSLHKVFSTRKRRAELTDSIAKPPQPRKAETQ